MRANELARRSAAEIRSGLSDSWEAVRACARRGCQAEGVMPGGLTAPRRAEGPFQSLSGDPDSDDPRRVLGRVSVFVLAVNEENASGGRVVTAPTNSAAGIVPAVLPYHTRFVPGADDGVARFLLTAGAIGVLDKENASISGAEVSCQAEVGSACSLAPGARYEVLGGSPAQVENGAEFGTAPNLGPTCDPVQVPCLERNAVAAVTAINAARFAPRATGRHVMRLDRVIRTMKQTGADLKVMYKQTARGGLAVNVVEC